MSKKKTPFDKTTNERMVAMFWENITAQIRQMDSVKWEGFYKSVLTLNKTNKPAIDASELRMTFDVLCEEELKRRGLSVETIIPTTTIESLNLMYTMKEDKRIYILNTENMCRVLRQHTDFAGRFRYDEFASMFQKLKRDKWCTLEDSDIIDVQTHISSMLPQFARISKGMVQDAIMKVCKDNKVDTAADFMRSLHWDGVARVDTWLTQVYGVEENEYHKAVGANWLKGLVKRIVFAGCKFDYVLVLEGKQGMQKSTSLATLGGAWYTETTMSADNKDFFMMFAGKAIIEFSEGETLSRSEVKRMKGIISAPVDRYRMPYERATLDYPRRCVFAMTTNQEQYLKDETGNRRWMPVKVVSPQANIEWLESNREQLFAEAYHRAVTLNEKIYEFPEEDMEREQNARMIHDPNEELIAEWYVKEVQISEKEDGITIHKVYSEVLHKDGARKPMNRYDEMQISDVLVRCLGLIKKQVMRDGVRLTRFFPAVMSTPSEIEAIKKTEQDKLF